MISVDFDFNKILLKLDKITNAAESAVRPAAQAGAQVFYEEARVRCPVSDEAHFFYGKNSKRDGVKYFFRPGNLRDSIYQFYNTKTSDKASANYSISWNHQKAPYGYMVEHGTSRAPANPFLRPAYDAARSLAVRRVKEVLQASLNGRAK